MSTAHDLFLSYASEDEGWADRLGMALARRGWTVWYARRLDGGDLYADEIDTQLRQAKCVIVLWSRHSIKSVWVKSEAEGGRELGRLVPVSFDSDIKLPRPFDQIHTIDLRRWRGDDGDYQFVKLVAAVEKKAGQPPRSPEPALEPQREPLLPKQQAQPAFANLRKWLASRLGSKRKLRVPLVAAGIVALVIFLTALIVPQLNDDPEVLGQISSSDSRYDYKVYVDDTYAVTIEYDPMPVSFKESQADKITCKSVIGGEAFKAERVGETTFVCREK